MELKLSSLVLDYIFNQYTNLENDRHITYLRAQKGKIIETIL